MRRFFAVLALVPAFGCSVKGPQGDTHISTQGDPRIIKVVGTLPGATLNGMAVSKVYAFVMGGDVISGTVNPANGQFEILKVRADRPTAILFTDSNDQFAGTVRMAADSSMLSLPFQLFKGTTASIDLGTLSAAGTLATTSKDLYASPLTGDSTVQTVLSEHSKSLSAFAQAPDLDSDGKVDIWQNGLQISVYPHFQIDGGAITAVPSQSMTYAGSPPATSHSIQCSKLVFDTMAAGTLPATATVTGPAGSGLSSTIVNARTSEGNDQWKLYETSCFSGGALPPSGTYTATLQYTPNTTGTAETRTIHFSVPDLSGAPSKLAAIVPTVSLYNDALNWATIRFMAPGSTTEFYQPALSPREGVQMEVLGSGTPCASASSSASGVLHVASTGDYLTQMYSFSSCTLPWANITGLRFTYHDIYWNSFQITYTK